MRHQHIAASLLLPLALSAPAHADESFVCANGRKLSINGSDRAQMVTDPCVQDWYSKTKSAADQKRGKPDLAAPDRSGEGARPHSDLSDARRRLVPDQPSRQPAALNPDLSRPD